MAMQSWSETDVRFNTSDDDAHSNTCSHEDDLGYLDRFKRQMGWLWATRDTEDMNKSYEVYVSTTLRELITYIIYLAVLTVLTFGMSFGTMYYYSNVLQNLFVNTMVFGTATSWSAIQGQSDLVAVMNGPMLSGWYWSQFYNGNNMDSSHINFILFETKLIGLPRLRQVRMDNNSCTVAPVWQNVIMECYDEYAINSESTAPFGLQNSTAWIYTPEEQLPGSTVSQGKYGKYGAGGYYIDLPNDVNEVNNILAMLFNNLWIDRGTRAVIIEFTMYNANINLFSVVKMIAEFSAAGGIFPYQEFTSVKLLRYVSPLDYFVLFSEILFLIFIIYYIVEEIMEIRIHKLKYFYTVWNVLDIFVVLIGIICIIFNVCRTIAVNNDINNLLQSPNEFKSFAELSEWQLKFTYILALTVFLSWIKIFKYISFNKTMTQLTVTLSKCSKDLLGFGVMFAIIFMAFAQLGCLIFGSQLDDYKEFTDASFTMFRMMLGDFNFDALYSSNAFLGPIFFISFVFFVFFVLMNMLLAIIDDTYTEVKKELEKEKNQFEIGEFFKQRAQAMLDKLNIKRDKIANLENMLSVVDRDNDTKISFDEWKLELMNCGYHEEDIESIFTKYDVNKDRIIDANEKEEMLRELDNQKTVISREIEENEKLESSLKGSQISGIKPDELYILADRVESVERYMNSMIRKLDGLLTILDKKRKTKFNRGGVTESILKVMTSTKLSSDEKRKRIQEIAQKEIYKLDKDSAVIPIQKTRKNVEKAFKSSDA